MINCFLIGQNIKNSRSKELYDKFSKRDSFDLNYELVDLKESEIDEFVAHFKRENFRGFNVTAPYKKTILKYLDDCSDEVKILEAANTVINESGKLIGYNTDVYGAYRAYSDFLASGSTIILGRGGASRAVIYAFRDRDLTVYVRDDNNENLLKIKSDLKFIYDFNNHDFKNVINATTVGFNESKTIINNRFKSQERAVDLIYTPSETLFLKKMKDDGVLVKNGFDMLYHQAVKAYNLYKGDLDD